MKIEMIAKLMDAFFGCNHSHYGFPMTVRSRTRSHAASLTGTYVVCMDCGTELPYDWKGMKVIDSVADRKNYTRSLAEKQAA